jgi:spoIIIJ-associated protein
MAEGISLAEQGSIAKEFLEGLLASMNIQAEITVKELDEETVELSVNASPPTELGVLVGPRGTTLQALQEVTRTVVQAKSPSRTDRILSTLRSTGNVESRHWGASPSKWLRKSSRPVKSEHSSRCPRQTVKPCMMHCPRTRTSSLDLKGTTLAALWWWHRHN